MQTDAFRFPQNRPFSRIRDPPVCRESAWVFFTPNPLFFATRRQGGHDTSRSRGPAQRTRRSASRLWPDRCGGGHQSLFLHFRPLVGPLCAVFLLLVPNRPRDDILVPLSLAPATIETGRLVAVHAAVASAFHHFFVFFLTLFYSFFLCAMDANATESRDMQSFFFSQASLGFGQGIARHTKRRLCVLPPFCLFFFFRSAEKTFWSVPRATARVETKGRGQVNSKRDRAPSPFLFPLAVCAPCVFLCRPCLVSPGTCESAKVR